MATRRRFQHIPVDGGLAYAYFFNGRHERRAHWRQGHRRQPRNLRYGARQDAHLPDGRYPPRLRLREPAAVAAALAAASVATATVAPAESTASLAAAAQSTALATSTVAAAAVAADDEHVVRLRPDGCAADRPAVRGGAQDLTARRRPRRDVAEAQCLLHPRPDLRCGKGHLPQPTWSATTCCRAAARATARHRVGRTRRPRSARSMHVDQGACRTMACSTSWRCRPTAV